jgi:hypothetical protein
MRAVLHPSIGLAACLLSFLTLCCGKEPQADERPSILILTADDWNWPQSAEVRDPNINIPKERLSRELDEELTRTGDPRFAARHEEVFYIPHYRNVEQRKK